MRVITLKPDDFVNVCRSLETECGKSKPDLVIGIANGGVYVAENLFVDTNHISIELRRDSSRAKDKASFLFKLLRRLPLWFLNIARILEAYLFTSNRNSRGVTVTLPVSVIDSIRKANVILIVDDAVDSGLTMKSIKESVMSVNGNATIKTAAITVTTKAPAIIPDFYLFKNRTLIRFPWSKDMK